MRDGQHQHDLRKNEVIKVTYYLGSSEDCPLQKAPKLHAAAAKTQLFIMELCRFQTNRVYDYSYKRKQSVLVGSSLDSDDSVTISHAWAFE